MTSDPWSALTAHQSEVARRFLVDRAGERRHLVVYEWIAGLVAAIRCAQQGSQVQLLEASGKPEPWQEAPRPGWQKPQVTIALAAIAGVLTVALMVLTGASAAKAHKIAELQKQAAQQGFYRWGSAWVNARQLESLKAAQAKIEETAQKILHWSSLKDRVIPNMAGWIKANSETGAKR